MFSGYFNHSTQQKWMEKKLPPSLASEKKYKNKNCE
jgi:hypothetical protein